MPRRCPTPARCAPPRPRPCWCWPEPRCDIARLLDDGPLAGNLAEVVAEESHGDAQKFLDRHTNDVIIEALQAAPVAWLGSEEMEHPLAIAEDGAVVVAVDPLDGSSNIDTNAPVGTIFSILPMPQASVTDPLAAFLRQGIEQVAAGYVIYGPHVALVLTMGQGTQRFILDRARGEFVLQSRARGDSRRYQRIRHQCLQLPALGRSRAPVRGRLPAGEEGPRGLNFNTRWLGSMVGDAYRIMARGGIYLYPADAREGYARGRLRLLYEANPIAWLVEQAGGAATDGATRILEILPTELHERVPLVFGSRIEVERIRDVYVAARFEGENSPLFGPRSLFRGAMRQE